MFGSIKITDFGKRHFDPKFSGTKITTHSIDVIENYVNSMVQNGPSAFAKVMDGYAPFCKLVVVDNVTTARVGSMKIDMSNYQYLRHGYSSRTADELPVLSRWFELPLPAPIAKHLVFVLYSKEQIDKEGQATEGEKYIPFEADWGVVAILGQSHSDEEPMSPVTMMRNALGVEEGGSGVPMDKEKYKISVEFWSQNAVVKS